MLDEPRLKRPKKSPIVAATEKLVESRLRDNQVEDLEKISLVWSTMLELETPMLPSQAAALLCVSDIIRATTLVDAERHWVEAAVFAIMGAHADMPIVADETSASEPIESQNQIGFSASSSNQA